MKATRFGDFKGADHVVIERDHFLCRHCRAVAPALPGFIPEVIKAGAAFAAVHRNCPKPAEVRP